MREKDKNKKRCKEKMYRILEEKRKKKGTIKNGKKEN